MIPVAENSCGRHQDISVKQDSKKIRQQYIFMHMIKQTLISNFGTLIISTNTDNKSNLSILYNNSSIQYIDPYDI